jgi:hypothetical protein
MGREGREEREREGEWGRETCCSIPDWASLIWDMSSAWKYAYAGCSTIHAGISA